jgi:hypothetical protein
MSNQDLIRYLVHKTSRLFFVIISIVNVENVPAFSQALPFINGKIIDSGTSQPLAFVTISLKNNMLGMHSNAEGDFRIKTDESFKSDSIIFRCIGYKRQSISYNDLNREELNIIRLVSVVYKLNEVEIKASRNILAARRMVTKAINNIRWNYPHSNFSYVGYYRDYQKRNSQYYNLNEAIIQADDNGFRSKSTLNRYKLLDFHINNDFPRIAVSPYYDNISIPSFSSSKKFIEGATLPDQGGNELLILMVHDAIRNNNTGSYSFVNTFSRDFLTNHSFTGISKAYNDNLLLYKISFVVNPKLIPDSLTVYGEIYIQPDNYSIHRLDYHSAYLKKGSEKKEMFNIRSEYSPVPSAGSKMCLSYISFDNTFNVIDTTDINYFRITKSYFVLSQPPMDFSLSTTLMIEFNNKLDKKCAEDTSCYRIMIGDRRAKVSKIDIGDTIVMLNLDPVFKNDSPEDRNQKESQDLAVFLINFRDENGRYLDDRKHVEYYQYREMFVQEYNGLVFNDEGCLITSKPLQENCISGIPSGKRYWMNSPAGIR